MPGSKYGSGRISDYLELRPQCYKTFFMLNLTEHKISTAHKN